MAAYFSKRCCEAARKHDAIFESFLWGYDRYKASKDKEKFLRGFESEIILFEAAAREIKKAGLAKLPSSDKLKAELDGLSARKTALQTELRKIQREETEYDTLRQNVDALLERPKEQEQQRQRSNDLE